MLARPNQRIKAISLVPLVDVLLIMLVFFMVTSTYLDLDMLPVTEAPETAAPSGAAPQARPETGTLFVRINADGSIIAAGQRLDLDGFDTLLAERLAADEDLRLLVLPSARSGVQALVSVMDRATLVGVTQLRIVRLEGE
jgi:biopolymer transport protein ExbD